MRIGSFQGIWRVCHPSESVLHKWQGILNIDMPSLVSVSSPLSLLLFFLWHPAGISWASQEENCKNKIKFCPCFLCRVGNTLIVQGIPDVRVMLISVLRQALISRMPLSWRENSSITQHETCLWLQSKEWGFSHHPFGKSAGTINPSQKKHPNWK